MSILDSTQLDDHQEIMVREFLGSELDRQTGKAEDRFRQFLADGGDIRPQYDYPASRIRGWVFSLAGAAVAACLGFLAAGVHLGKNAPSNPAIDNATSVSLPWVQQTVDQQMYDAGTFVNGNGDPMRILQRRKWETTRWFDDNKQLKAQSVVPEDDTVYVKMKTY